MTRLAAPTVRYRLCLTEATDFNYYIGTDFSTDKAKERHYLPMASKLKALAPREEGNTPLEDSLIAEMRLIYCKQKDLCKSGQKKTFFADHPARIKR